MARVSTGAFRLSAFVIRRSFLVLGHRRQQRVQPAVVAFGVQAVAVDPRGQPLQRGGVQMHGPALRIAGPGDQTRLLQHLNVLGHRLFGDGERSGQLVDRRRSPGQSRHHRAPDGIRECHEGTVQLGLVVAISRQ